MSFPLTLDQQSTTAPRDNSHATNTHRRRRRRNEASSTSTTMVGLKYTLSLFLLLLLVSTASGFQVSATGTHHGTSKSEQRTTQLAVSSACIAPPAHHLAWIRSQEDNKYGKYGKVQKSTFSPYDIDWVCSRETGDCDIPVEALATFNDTSAKEAWAARYTTVEALRQTFGRNKNPLWGDLDAVTTRRLYKTLLPRALLELYHCHGASSEDLAPLAYRARVAAKLYARERSTVPCRLSACMFDGVRNLRKYGSFQMSGMSYPQLWEKYARQIMEEGEWEDEEDLTSKICFKILQKSCETNSAVDSLLLEEDAMDLQEITRKLERDVFSLLKDDEAAKQWSIQRYKTLKTLLRIKRRIEHVGHHEDKHHSAKHATQRHPLPIANVSEKLSRT